MLSYGAEPKESSKTSRPKWQRCEALATNPLAPLDLGKALTQPVPVSVPLPLQAPPRAPCYGAHPIRPTRLLHVRRVVGGCVDIGRPSPALRICHKRDPGDVDALTPQEHHGVGRTFDLPLIERLGAGGMLP
jgi:hypothetical protein